MRTVLIPHSSRNAALGVAISGVSGVAGLLEPITGCLGLLFVILFAHFFGRGFGRLAAGFASLGMAAAALAFNHSPLTSGAIARCTVAIAAAWLSAELVSRRHLLVMEIEETIPNLRRLIDALPAMIWRATYLKQTEMALEQREHQLQKLTETIPAMLWCNSPRGGLTYINRKTFDFVGLDVSQLADLGYRKTLHPDDVDSLLQAWTHSIETGEPYSHVARLRRKDGAYRWFQHTAEAMRDCDGNIVQWCGLSLDIDERQRAEDRLRQAQADLARATQIATVAELSASIAHELNQPLTSVIANAQACKRWLAAYPPNLSEARTSVESVVRDARSADETMQSIRALFKRQSFQKRQRNVKDMVLESVRLLQEDEAKHTAEIEFDLPDSLPPVFVDQIQIQQVLLNLIMNAIEATENSGRTPKILITACPLDDQFVLLEVVDNGSGIVGGDSIFDAFFTTKSKGMGIGLAVSRSIIEAHEGRLTAANNERYGATFSVVLPVLPA
ncbi:PAS domain-containing sensor histidine kinase [Burkholderia sp. L27(2015)]|uniref:PAS domain-containing sensor histidine kinase n=1 Tax=Burkholderia sp. L27(2015) TaxID=1641858 RepID=UPI00131E88A7|nr:PAS domain-containing sensor histidine kinase [Burkholderia sp. L27(2015)]